MTGFFIGIALGALVMLMVSGLIKSIVDAWTIYRTYTHTISPRNKH